MLSRTLYSLLLITLFISCEEDDNVVPTNPDSESIKYIHLSHTRLDVNPFIIPELENVSYDNYNLLMLGGDLAWLSSEDEQTMNYLDSIFEFDSPNTLWALGNHDYSDLNRVKSYTNRNIYYSYHLNGITYVVLDTQDSLSNIVGDQKSFLFNILDTISESSHLILLHHKLIWLYDNPNFTNQINTISNGRYGDCFYCVNTNNFMSTIYPKLVEVQNRGIQTICIGGDIGKKVNEFEFRTDDGIYLMASGVDKNQSLNKYLEFSHNVESRSLNWQFKSVSSLSKVK